MRKRFLNVAIALGMVIGLLAAAIGSAGAADTTSQGNAVNWIFFPWVPNGETVDSTGPWYGSVSVQNTESAPIDIHFGMTAGGIMLPQTAKVQPHATYTFSAADLFKDLTTNTGAGVAVAATWDVDNPPSFCTATAGPSPLSVQRDDDVQNLPSGITKTADQDIVAALPIGATILGAGTRTGSGTTADPYVYQYVKGTDFSVSGNEITWLTDNRPAENDLYDVYYTTLDCGTHSAPVIAGAEKQATPETNAFGVQTSDTDLTVDGYSAVQASDVSWGPNSKACTSINTGQTGNTTPGCNNLGSTFLGLPIGNFFNGGSSFGFDGTSYLPIVQANWSGWDTIINLTNVDASAGQYTQATVTFYAAGQGTGNQGTAVKQVQIPQGGSVQIDAADVLGDTPFVGSAWITTDSAVVANAVRIKSSTNMAIINTSAPSVLATTSPNAQTVDGDIPVMLVKNGEVTQYAPLVYKDYNGWNTGINIVNTSEVENQVTVQIVNRDGTTVGTSTTAIPPKGMQYVYMPAGQDQGLGNGSFGAAIISGNLPFYAAVDEVKYSTGEAMSYLATGTTINKIGANCDPYATTPDNTLGEASNRCLHGNELNLAIFQNGHNTNGVEHGDASGINIFNSGNKVAKGTVTFYALDGSLQTPSNIGTVPFSVASLSSGYVYAPSMAQMTPGIQLSAVVTATQGRISAVSNNVNYDVNGDGGSVFNLSNQFGQYRFTCSQQQCGLQAIVRSVAGGGNNP